MIIFLKKWQWIPLTAGFNKPAFCTLIFLNIRILNADKRRAEVSIVLAAKKWKIEQNEATSLTAVNGNFRLFKEIFGWQQMFDIGFDKCFPWSFIHADVTRAILGADFQRKSGLLLVVANKKNWTHPLSHWCQSFDNLHYLSQHPISE